MYYFVNIKLIKLIIKNFYLLYKCDKSKLISYRGLVINLKMKVIRRLKPK